MSDTLSAEVIGNPGQDIAGSPLSGEVEGNPGVAQAGGPLSGEVSVEPGAGSDTVSGECCVSEEIFGGGVIVFPEEIGGECCWESELLEGECCVEEDVLGGEVEGPPVPLGFILSLKLGHQTVTGVTTLTTASPTITYADAAGGAFTITLPDAAVGDGCYYLIKRINTGGNKVTIAGAGTDLIDGLGTYRLNSTDQSITLHSDGTEWRLH